MNKILYLHGFASSADSTKAKLIESFVKKNTSSTKVLIPNLNNNIKNAYEQIEEIIRTESPSSIIGSSLGGFFGTYFAKKYNLLCVNINPAIPPINMSEYIGE
ncbi:MAG: esterase, partial [SAR86 cluster bacterium]|nr:esterase [SAR86 cluster bacterium]